MDNNVSRIKSDRPIGSKDVAPRKRRGMNQESTLLNLEKTTLKEETTPKKLKPMKISLIPRILKFHKLL